jgi:GNAT superfamily N-acetyltransferase
VEIARRFPVTDQDVYTHNLVVLPAYRGKRLAVPLGAYLMRALYEHGYRRIFSVVKTDNAPSLRAVRRMGGHVIGRMISIRLPGWWYVRVTSVGDEPLADKNCGARAG